MNPGPCSKTSGALPEPSSSNQVRDAGRQLSIRLIDPDAQIVVETGGSVQPIPQQVLKQFDSGRDQFMLGKPHLHNEYYRIQVAAPITTRTRRSFVALIEIDASPLMYLLTERSGLGMTGEFVVGRVKDGQLELMNPLQDAQLTNREISHFPYLAAAVAGKMDYGTSVDRHGQPSWPPACRWNLTTGGWPQRSNVGEAYEPLSPWLPCCLAWRLVRCWREFCSTYVFTFRITRPLMQLAQFCQRSCARAASRTLPDRSPQRNRRTGPVIELAWRRSCSNRMPRSSSASSGELRS